MSSRPVLVSTGRELQLDGRSRVALPGPDGVWHVATGQVLVRLADAAQPAAGPALFGVPAGGMLAGQPESGPGAVLTATGVPGTTARLTTWTELLPLPSDAATDAGRAVDDWVARLSTVRRVGATTFPRGSTLVPPAGFLEVAPGTALRAREPVWLLVHAGALAGDDAQTAGPGELLLLGPGGWARSELETSAEVLHTASLLSRSGADPDTAAPPAVGAALAAFARAAQESHPSDSSARRAATERHTQAALRGAVDSLVTLLEPRHHEAGRPDEPLAACLARLGAGTGALGSDLSVGRGDAGSARADLGPANRVATLVREGELRARRVTLHPGWSRTDSGPLLGFLVDPEHRPGSSDNQDEPASSDRPVVRPVVLWRSWRGYRVDDPTAGTTRPVRSIAAQLATEGYQVYPPLMAVHRSSSTPPAPEPAGQGSAPAGVRDLLRHGLRGQGGDLVLLLAVAAAAVLLGLAAPALTTEIFGRILPSNDRTLLTQATAAMVVAALGAGAFVATQSFAVERLAQRLQQRWQTAVLDRLLRLPATFFAAHTPGELAARLLDLDSVRNTVTSAIVGPVLGLVFGGFGIGLMFALAPGLAAAGLVVLAAAAAVSAVLAWRQSRAAAKVAAADRSEQNDLVAVMTGVSKIRVARAEGRVVARRLGGLHSRTQAQASVERASTAMGLLGAALPVVATAVLWTIAGATVDDSDNGIGAGTYLGFAAAFASVTTAVFGVVTNARSVVEAIPRITALRPILAAAPENARRGAYPGVLSGAIELNGVSFGYSGGPTVLDEVSFRVEPGEMLAIVGPSGSGKSTLLRILLGFEEPTAGKVYYDNSDLSRLDLTAVRRQLGVVLQNDRLFGGEISRAILGASPLGLPAAWRAAELAGVAEDIQALPMGMHTLVDARGSTISGGQRQRLAIARALVGDPRILLFDEATSALDNRTQHAVTASLEGLSATRIVIAHRLSTIRRADKVVVLDHGRVIETGTVDELLARDGMFAAIARRQQL